MAPPPDGDGRDRPAAVPWAGRFGVVWRIVGDIGTYQLGVIAAGIAFNEFFALFPALAAAVALYGLLADPATVDSQVAAVAAVAPKEVASMVEDQLRQLANGSHSSLGLSFAIAVAVALWGATSGIKALIAGLNVVYHEDEKRGFVRLNLTALALTLGAIVFGLLALVLVAALPAALDHLPLGGFDRTLASVARWPLLVVFMVVGLAAFYRLAPARARPRRRWISWGAAAATLLWVAGSALFSFYVANFGKFNRTYGSFAAVAVMLLWFELTSFCVLLGGLLDAELEGASPSASPDAPAARPPAAP